LNKKRASSVVFIGCVVAVGLGVFLAVKFFKPYSPTTPSKLGESFALFFYSFYQNFNFDYF
jgi:hypothetical protein